MKKIVKFQTCDGVLHDTAEDARRHAEDRLYGAKLMFLAAALRRMTKYREITDYIDAHLDDFSELLRFKADTLLDAGEGDE